MPRSVHVQEVRHIACARCRERKVKCDGEKPSCRRCLRNKSRCHYVRGRKLPARNEWTQHLRTFSSQPASGSCTPPRSQPSLPLAQPSDRGRDVFPTISFPHSVGSTIPLHGGSTQTLHPEADSWDFLSSTGGVNEWAPAFTEDCLKSEPYNDFAGPLSKTSTFDPYWSAFFGAGYASEDFMTGNWKALPRDSRDLRSYTPASQETEASSSSFDCYSVSSVPHATPVDVMEH